ncbi:MAG: nucleotidyltransferase domain-containing protein [Bacteroidetes bacterium]|nr:nucleotidyltransferase domain-containing protein [Bacteroidota bacterium]
MTVKEQISYTIQTIITGYTPEKIIVFGSFATDNANENSDLDLLIIKKTSDPFYHRLRQVRKLFNKQLLPLDLFVYSPEEFEENKNKMNHIANIAMKQGVVAYEK